MAQIYFDDDADISYVKDNKIAILGYGNQGRSQALNLRDSGLQVIIGSRSDPSAEKAQIDGFEVYDLADASKQADIIFMLIPDEIMPQIYKTHIEPGISPHNMLVFAHGYNIAYGFIRPPAEVDIVLLAPRMIGHGVRTTYKEGHGFPSLIAVEQDGSGKALSKLLALSKGIGSTRMGVIMSSFEEETVVDLFAEQTGQLYSIRRNIEILVEAGYDPWAAILEFYASGEGIETEKAFVEKGLWEHLDTHSRTSQYGQEVISRLNPEEEAQERVRLKNILDKIQTGEFAKDWTLEQQADSPVLRQVRKKNLNHPVIKSERELYKILGRS
jgi:ketol-acid reductoisomerase